MKLLKYLFVFVCAVGSVTVIATAAKAQQASSAENVRTDPHDILCSA